MAVQLEEERRRRQAQRNLEMLQEYKVDIRSELQQQISQISDKGLKQIEFYSKDQILSSMIKYEYTQNEIPTSVQKVNENVLVGFKTGQLLMLDSQLQNIISQYSPVDRIQFKETIKQLIPSELSNIFSPAPPGFKFHGAITSIQVVDKLTDANILISIQLKRGSLFVFFDQKLNPHSYIYFPGNGPVSCQATTSAGQMLVSTPNNDLIYIDVVHKNALTELMGHTELINDLQYFPGGAQALSCGLDQTVRIFDCERQGSLIYEFPGRFPAKVAVLNQQYLAAAGDVLAIFSRDKRKPLMAIKSTDLIEIEEQNYSSTCFTALCTIPGFNVMILGVYGTLIIAQIQDELLINDQKTGNSVTNTIYDLQTIKGSESDEQLPINIISVIKIGNGHINDIQMSINEKSGEFVVLYCFGTEQPGDRISVKNDQKQIQHTGRLVIGKVTKLRRSRFK